MLSFYFYIIESLPHKKYVNSESAKSRCSSLKTMAGWRFWLRLCLSISFRKLKQFNNFSEYLWFSGRNQRKWNLCCRLPIDDDHRVSIASIIWSSNSSVNCSAPSKRWICWKSWKNKFKFKFNSIYWIGQKFCRNYRNWERLKI